MKRYNKAYGNMIYSGEEIRKENRDILICYQQAMCGYHFVLKNDFIHAEYEIKMENMPLIPPSFQETTTVNSLVSILLAVYMQK